MHVVTVSIQHVLPLENVLSRVGTGASLEVFGKTVFFSLHQFSVAISFKNGKHWHRLVFLPTFPPFFEGPSSHTSFLLERGRRGVPL